MVDRDPQAEATLAYAGRQLPREGYPSWYQWPGQQCHALRLVVAPMRPPPTSVTRPSPQRRDGRRDPLRPCGTGWVPDTTGNSPPRFGERVGPSVREALPRHTRLSAGSRTARAGRLGKQQGPQKPVRKGAAAVLSLAGSPPRPPRNPRCRARAVHNPRGCRAAGRFLPGGVPRPPRRGPTPSARSTRGTSGPAAAAAGDVGREPTVALAHDAVAGIALPSVVGDDFCASEEDVSGSADGGHLVCVRHAPHRAGAAAGHNPLHNALAGRPAPRSVRAPVGLRPRHSCVSFVCLYGGVCGVRCGAAGKR